MRILIFIGLFLFMAGCSKEETYTPQDMFFMAYNFDNSIEEVRIAASDPSKSVKCSSYGEGCIEGSPKRFKVRLVEMIVAQYHTKKGACLAALKIDQYYVRNWLLDDVKGEPVLESFVKEVYDAKNPQSEKDCE
ncbi:hypothetical protein [Bacteriovorax sp. Seq25_V]|uniref:hypothetical protein n=1 Tax=Bacteriovorax sp. Seq25_V TaxID=1201288 RepID=UPI000389FD65|nr:hypothetical protein [Bacteriovorax sp. Seq25_V]EQC43780.1 putative lipoprotein [Bacteriovorax sp. Seq25_V]